MNFNSLTFLIFFPIVLILYHLLPSKARPALLLIASYFFYMSWNYRLVYLILGTTLISYVAGILIGRYRGKRIFSKLCMAFAIIASLSVLFIYKYADFAIGTINSISSLFGGKPLSTLDLILPVGISFYTFQTLSYVIDVYRDDVPVEKNFWYYALFVSFFPQLVAGPIERPENLLPQLRTHARPSSEDFRAGLRMMAVGFFKKIVLADGVASIVNAVYNSPNSRSGIAVLVATVLFSLQIYGDFSGYTDIAIGSARMLGIRLMKNFDRPYISQSIKEFWARWHISLSSWFRDYLYIPLGGNRKGRARKILNVFIVFLVSGIWHGAAWTFVLWGALHGVYRVIEEIFSKPLSRFMKYKSTGFVAFRTVVTFILVSFAWIFFRANSIGDLGRLLSSLFTGWGGGVTEMNASLAAIGLTPLAILRIALSAALLMVINRIIPDNKYPVPDGAVSVRRSSISSKLVFVLLVLCIATAWLMLLEHHVSSSFIYFQF